MSLENGVWVTINPSRGILSPFLRVAGGKRRQSAANGYGGYLTKKGQLIRSWKKRFFFLSFGCLEYFEDESAFEQNVKNGHYTNETKDLDSAAPFRPKGGLLLVGASVVITNLEELTIEVRCADRTLVLKAGDLEALKNWQTQLQLHIDLANEDALSMNDVNNGVYDWLERIGQIAAEAESRLKCRQTFKKFCPGVMGAKSHEREFKLANDGLHLLWGAPNFNETTDKTVKAISIASLHYVEGGWGNLSFSKGNESLCLRIGGAERELNIESQSVDIRDSWVADLYCVAYFLALNKLQENVGANAAKRLTKSKTDLSKAVINAKQGEFREEVVWIINCRREGTVCREYEFYRRD